MNAELIKVDEGLGIVFGFAIVTHRDGQAYYDTQGDHVRDSAMLKAAADFSESMISGDMHEGTYEENTVQDGDVVFMFPLTVEIAKSLNITTEQHGLIVGIRPSPDVLQKFKTGERTGFSIGGKRISEEVVEQ